MTIAVICFILATPTALLLIPLQQAHAVSYNTGSLAKFHAPVSSVVPTGGKASMPNGFGSGTKSGSGATLPSVGGPTTIPGDFPSPITQNSVRFIVDRSYAPQSETTVGVDPKYPYHVVGGFNDGRYFFCSDSLFGGPITCPDGSQASLSGFTTSSNGGLSVAKSDQIPAMCVPFEGGDVGGFCEYVTSWGDPSIAFGPNGRAYYASLAISPFDSGNGIMIAESTPSLWNTLVSCTSYTASIYLDGNSCWNTTFVYGNLSPSASTFEDKELIAVDWDSSSAYYGSVYIAWDHFYPSGYSSTYLARCTPDISSCTMLSGGSTPTVQGTDNVISGSYPFVAFSTPAVDKNGHIYVSACNYGTASTFGPVTCFDENSNPGISEVWNGPYTIMSFQGEGTTFPAYTGIVGFATEQFRTSSIPVMAVDTSSASNNLYFTIAVCTVNPSYYMNAFGAGYTSDWPGNCGGSSVLLSRSTNGGSTWSAPITLSGGGSVNVQPWVSVDPTSGRVVVAFYTSKFDSFNHRLDVALSVSTTLGTGFLTSRVTTVSDEPNSDPEMFCFQGLTYCAAAGFGGSQVVPQYGDYFQVQALASKNYILFTGNFAVEQGAFQADPFLLVK